MNTALLIRQGIGPMSATKLALRMALVRTGQSFERCKESALAALARGDRDGARFWAMHARFDWRSFCLQMNASTL